MEASWGQTADAFAELRQDWFEALPVDDPGKASAEKRLRDNIRQAIEVAVERFLTVFGGKDRTRRGFVEDQSDNGILQLSIHTAYGVGAARGASFTGSTPPTLTSAFRERLNAQAFERLTADGRFRFETRLDEIKQQMLDGFERGENPLAIARKLGRDLGGYERGRLQTLIRTEMGLASEQAILDVGSAGGVRLWRCIGDPLTDQACVSAQQGSPYTTEQIRGLLPRHPNCFCSAIMWEPE